MRVRRLSIRYFPDPLGIVPSSVIARRPIRPTSKELLERSDLEFGVAQLAIRSPRPQAAPWPPLSRGLSAMPTGGEKISLPPSPAATPPSSEGGFFLCTTVTPSVIARRRSRRGNLPAADCRKPPLRFARGRLSEYGRNEVIRVSCRSFRCSRCSCRSSFRRCRCGDSRCTFCRSFWPFGCKALHRRRWRRSPGSKQCQQVP